MTSASLRSAARRLGKRLAIGAGLEAIALSDAGRLAPAAAGRGVIFTLHHVRPAQVQGFAPNAHLSITPEFLDQAIVAARQCGLHPVHLEDLPRLLADPSDTRKFACYTLDDGYRDNAEHAAPVFRRHGVPYTIFVTPGFVERTRTMWWETAEALTRAAVSFTFDFGQGEERVISDTPPEKFLAFERLAAFVQTTDEDEAVARLDRAALQAGVDARSIVDDDIMTSAELQTLAADPLARLGAHTLTHPNLARVDAGRLAQELEQSAKRVAGYGGRPATTLAYPYGSPHAVGPREIAAALSAGFTAAVTTQPGVLNAQCLGRITALPRVSLNGHYQKGRHVRALASGLPFKLM